MTKIFIKMKKKFSQTQRKFYQPNKWAIYVRSKSLYLGGTK